MRQNMTFMLKLLRQIKNNSIGALLIFLLSSVYGQVESRKVPEVSESSEFFIDAISFSSGDSSASRVDLYVQVPNDALQFVKKDGVYISRYEVTVNVFTDDKSSVSEKMWSDEIRVPSFDETGSKLAYGLTQRSIFVPPGMYTLRAQLRDNESKKLLTVVKKISVSSYFAQTLTVSDIMLVNRVTSDGEKRSLLPNVSGNIGENNNAFSIFFEIYSQQAADSVQLHYFIVNQNGQQLLNKYQLYGIHAQRSQIITRFDSTHYSTGSYTLAVEVKSMLDSALPVASSKKPFIVQWGNMPLTISNLDLAVRQLRYIAKDHEYDDMEDAPTEEEKRRLFDEFWRKRDPNPDTKRNEFMEEYYSRVEYANQNFSHYVPGWRTDMGMVFILFGSPNNVERHPFDINAKPYEIWSYYDYNRSVVFVDETGFGDYRLTTPIYDMLQRLKY